MRRQRARPIHLEEAVETVLDPHGLDATGGGRFHDGADDRVEPGRVAAAGEDADFLDYWHLETFYRDENLSFFGLTLILSFSY